MPLFIRITAVAIQFRLAFTRTRYIFGMMVRIMMILDFCKEAKSVPEIMENFGFESRTSFRRKYLNALVEEGRLKMTMPDKPKSKNQKYYS